MAIMEELIADLVKEALPIPDVGPLRELLLLAFVLLELQEPIIGLSLCCLRLEGSPALLDQLLRHEHADTVRGSALLPEWVGRREASCLEGQQGPRGQN